MKIENEGVILENVTMAFGKQIVLEGFSHCFSGKGIVCILGASGCGKTTLLRLICGLEQPSSGKLKGIEGKKIAVLFQEDRLLPWLTAWDNVQIVCNNEKRIQELFNQMELSDAAKKYPKEMSGGMKRRTAIIKAVAFGGDIFLIDEPFQGIDDKRKMKIISILKNEMENKLCIIVTHDLREAKLLTDNIFQMNQHGLEQL